MSYKKNQNTRTHISTLGLARNGGRVIWDPMMGGFFGLLPAIEDGSDLTWIVPDGVEAGDRIVFAMSADAEEVYVRMLLMLRYSPIEFLAVTSNKAGRSQEAVEDVFTDEYAIACCFAGRAFAEATVSEIHGCGRYRRATLSNVRYLDLSFPIPRRLGFDDPSVPLTFSPVTGSFKEAFDKEESKTHVRKYTKKAVTSSLVENVKNAA